MPFLRPTRDRTPELLGEAIGKRTGHTYYLEDYQLREGILLRVWSPDLKVVGHVNAWERGDTGAIVTPKVAAQLPVYMSDIRIEQECREEGLARALIAQLVERLAQKELCHVVGFLIRDAKSAENLDEKPTHDGRRLEHIYQEHGYADCSLLRGSKTYEYLKELKTLFRAYP